ncbi:phage tail sheath subtilisin-like domain-containing protein [Myxococcota bacterium]|nr:phage tail sheath subtilisin-like domain-containing protein [Myxococcota bacterium]
MPEYLSPGVYVEEVSYRQKTIEGVSTSTAAFVGATRFGPTEGEPVYVTNFGEFERVFGSLDDLDFDGGGRPNYLAHAVRSFFEEGGRRLYVSRIFTMRENDDGIARWTIDDPTLSPAGGIEVRARYPGSGGNLTVRFIARLGQNAFRQVPFATGAAGVQNVLRGVRPFDVVRIERAASPGVFELFRAVLSFDPALNRQSWELEPEAPTSPLSNVRVADLVAGDQLRVLTASVEVWFHGSGDRSESVVRRELWDDCGLDDAHERGLSRIFGATLERRSDQLTTPIIIDVAGRTGPELARVLFAQPRSHEEVLRLTAVLNGAPRDPTILATLGNDRLSELDRTFQGRLTNGDDGAVPTAAAYEGVQATDPRRSTGLRTFEHVADISIVAAPGHSHGASTEPDVQQVTALLVGHAERMRYRIAVLDSPRGASLDEIREFKARIDSSHAALYYPWVQVLDPVTNRPTSLPPSGAIAGIYARNDVERGVHKAPANEVLRTAIGLEQRLNTAHQDVLNPEGINCSRFFEGRGFRVWGARTTSSDGEWKYVNLRRYFAYLERSIDVGTQWAVFEPNGDRLWRNVRQTIEDFLFNEWQNDRLFGLKPGDAYFVRCDRATMSQNDIDQGRMVCQIGVAPLRPAEFVIFRIGQWTSDRRG